MLMRNGVICWLGLLAAVWTNAHAQDALGDGRGLENNLSTQTRLNFQRPSLANEVRFRNAIATGNAPGGVSFRGDVGYLAPSDFRGELGSDDLFAFRRDALYSGLAGMGIRGTEALQFQFSMTTGALPPRNLVGSLTYGRGPNAGVTTGRLPSGLDPAPVIQRAPEQVEPDTTMMWSLRAPSAYETNRAYLPVLLLSSEPRAEDQIGLTASELRGVRRTDLVDEPPAGRIDTAMPVEPIETSFTKLMERLEQQAEQLPKPPASEEEADTRPEWMKRLEELRQDLVQPTPDNTPGQGNQPSSDEPQNPDELLHLRTNPETLGLLKRAGGSVDSFVPPDATGVYAEHMRVGQQFMAAERYFDAEERFAHALTIRPGDVDAQVGRIHAQIGAGMFLSAAVNLRSLLLAHPEVASMTYDAAVLPSAERTDEVLARFRANLADAARENASLPQLRLARACGLLMAYLGRQRGDAALITEGLAAARAAVERAYREAPNQEDARESRLFDLIEQVWVEKTPE